MSLSAANRDSPSTHIEVQGLETPPGVAKLRIVQHTYVSRENPITWFWYVVGTFYDEDDNVLWSTELALGHRCSGGYNLATGEFDAISFAPTSSSGGEWLLSLFLSHKERLLGLNCLSRVTLGCD
jgi:hypothetical protein